MDLKVAFGVGLGAVVAIFAACTQDAKRPDLPALLGNPDPAEVTGPDGVSRSPLAACDDFGTLSGSSATIRLIGSSLESASFNATDRPQTTKLTILASGVPAQLVGKSTAVGTGENANFATCTHCFVVAIGCGGSDCSRAALFYPRSGSALFTSVASQSGQMFQGTLENAELVQVTIDTQTQRSTPVIGGACIKVSTLTFGGTAPADSAPAPAGAPAPGPTSTTSSGHGGSTSGGLDGAKSNLL